MATAAQGVKRPAAKSAPRAVKEATYLYEGKDKNGKTIRGEMRAGGEAVVNAQLRRQGVRVTKVKKQRLGGKSRISDKDITLFTRQLATMMKAGVPLLQSFDIVCKGHSNRSVAKLLMDVKTIVSGSKQLLTVFYLQNCMLQIYKALTIIRIATP